MNDTIFIIISLGLFCFVSYKKIEISIYLISIFLASYLVRFQIYGLPFTLLEMMILILFVAWILRSVITKQKIFYSNFFPLILVFLLMGVVAVIVSPDTRAALGLFKAYFFEPIFFFLVIINVVKEKRQINHLLFSLGLGALFISLIAIWQYLGLFPGLEPYISESPMRATSLFDFPTAVGKYLAPIVALFLAIALLSKNNRRQGNLFFWGVIILSVLAVIFSFTRGALLGIAAAIVFISFFHPHRKYIWLFFGLAILFILVLPQGRAELLSVFSGQDTSADVHSIMWEGTFRLLKDNPITGAGLAGFPAVYNLYRDAAHVELFPYPDNWFLAVWSELGLAGVVVFSWLIFRYVKEAVFLVRKKTEPHYDNIAIGLLAVIICLFVHGLVDTPYFKNDLSVMFWLFIGLLVIIQRNFSESNNTKISEKK